MSATKYIARVTQITVMQEGVMIYDESATRVSIEDEGGGEFVEITQYPDGKEKQAIRISPEEWPAIRKVVDEMMKQCKDREERK